MTIAQDVCIGRGILLVQTRSQLSEIERICATLNPEEIDMAIREVDPDRQRETR